MSTKTEFNHNTAAADDIDEALPQQSPWDDGSFISRIDVIGENDDPTEDDEWSHDLDDREVWVCGAESVSSSSIDDWWDDVQRRLFRFDEGMEEWGYNNNYLKYEEWDEPERYWSPEDDEDTINMDYERKVEYLMACLSPEELPEDSAQRDSAKAQHLVLEAVVEHDRHSLPRALNHTALEAIEVAWLGKYTLLELLGEDVWHLYAEMTCYDDLECYDDMGFPI